jgi:sirohydrochlorin ferrochelatase
MPPATALLLIAHGSRRAEANADLEHLAGVMRERDEFSFVLPSYLELCDPGIVSGGELCVAAGARRVILLPYFLSAGVHVVEDLTAARSELAKRHPDVEFVLAEPLGRHPLLAEVVAERARTCFISHTVSPHRITNEPAENQFPR